MGAILRGARTVEEASTAGVSVKKEDCVKLSISAQLTLSEAAR